MKKSKTPVVKPSFSDAAKRRAGIEPSDFETETRRIQLEHKWEVNGLQDRIASLERAIDNVKVLLLDGRRGDAMKELSRVRPAPQPPAGPKPDGPRVA